MPTSRQEKAIAALLSTGTIEKAAEQVGVTARTMRNWLVTPDFAAAYRAERLKLVEHASGLMQNACVSAVLCLMRNLSCGKPGAEIAAANSLLDKSLQAVEQFDLLGRIEQLEAQAALSGVNSYANRGTQTNGQTHGGPGR